MNTLPHEILEFIFSFIDDKIDLSMCCTSIKQLLDDMYNLIKVHHFNDTYWLKTHFSQVVINTNIKSHLNPVILKNIDKINNHKCFDMILHKIYHPYDKLGWSFENIPTKSLLLRQICISGNIPNCTNIHYLINDYACNTELGQLFWFDQSKTPECLSTLFKIKPDLKTRYFIHAIGYRTNETYAWRKENILYVTIPYIIKAQILTFDEIKEIIKTITRRDDPYDISFDIDKMEY